MIGLRGEQFSDSDFLTEIAACFSSILSECVHICSGAEGDIGIGDGDCDDDDRDGDGVGDSDYSTTCS
jgi:hypothetical protein